MSFDVANKSLAVAVIRFECTEIINDQLAVAFAAYQKNKKVNQTADMSLLLHNYLELVKKCNAILAARFQIEHLEVVDLIPGRKVSETSAVERSFLLSRALESLRTRIPAGECKFLIEYQMGPNDKSRAVSSQILLFCTTFMHSVTEAEARIKLVGPSLKNKLHIKNINESYHAHYLAKFKTNYAANKNHTKFLLNKLTAAYGQDTVTKKIKKKNMDDAADAICMAVAYFMFVEAKP